MTGPDNSKIAPPPSIPSITRIKMAVAEEYGVSAIDLESDRRARAIAHPRQAAMWLCRRLTGRSLPEIGRHFGGRDHTTVMHACRAVERRLADPDESERLTRLADRLGEGEDVWTSSAARADWALQEVHELMREVERLQDRLARFSLVLASSTGKRPRIEVPVPPEPNPEPTPAPAAAPPADEAEPSLPERGLRIGVRDRPGQAWRCRTAACRGTRQPGRDHCAECITAAAISGGAPDAAPSPARYARREA